ncbi:MAG: hypothetical protein ACXVJG_00225 [Mucilaginibacter sp.]
MKVFTLCFISFLYLGAQAQTYSSDVNDREITSFMNNFLRVNLKHEPPLDNHIILWDLSILKESAVNIFFNRTDTGFLKKQIRGLKKGIWNHRFNGTKLIKDIPNGSTLSTTIYSYSIPLFSTDRKRALLIEGFYCGLLCGGGAYYIFERQANGNWKKIKKFKEWAE